MKKKFIALCLLILAISLVFVGCKKPDDDDKPDDPTAVIYSTRNFLSVNVGAGYTFEYGTDGKIVSYCVLGDDSVLSAQPVGENILTVFNGLLDDSLKNGDFTSAEKILFSSSDNFNALKVFGKVSAYFVEFAYANGLKTTPYFNVAFLTDAEIVAANEAGVHFGMYDLCKKADDTLGQEQLIQTAKECSLERFIDGSESTYDFQVGKFVMQFLSTNAISKIDACKAILNKVETDGESLKFVVDEMYRDYLNGREVWTARLHYDNDYYIYVVDAVSSEVVSVTRYIHSSTEGYVAPTNAEVKVSDLYAFETSCADARVENSGLSAFSVRLDKVDGEWCYNVDLKTDFSQFHYVINAATGKIEKTDCYSLAYASEIMVTNIISADTAVSIAIIRANVNDIKVKSLLVERLYDGGWVYEVSFFVSGKFYQVTVTSNGRILDYLTDGNTVDDDDTPSEYIPLATAKEIAYDDAGMGAVLADDDLYNLKTRFTRESGMAVYKISFVYNGKSFEYVINAIDSEILKSAKVDIENNEEFTMDMIEKVVNDFLYPDGSSSVSVIGILLPGYGIDNATYVADFDHGVYRYTITIDATTGHIVNYERYKTIG